MGLIKICMALVIVFLVLGFIFEPQFTGQVAKKGGEIAWKGVKWIFVKIVDIAEWQATERLSPKDRVKEEDITVYKNEIIIKLDEEVRWARYTDTNSMDPLLDEGANGFEIIPKSSDDIELGDVIAYKHEKGTIIHRVVEIGEDEKGWFAIAKGDNNPSSDPWKIRFNNIEGVLIGVVY